MQYLIATDLLPKPSKRRSGSLMAAVKFIVAHDTGNPGSTAQQNVNYYKRTSNEKSASAHFFVDDRQIIECVPALTSPPEKAWHVLYAVPTDNQMFGCNANDCAVGVEYCYGGEIDADEAYRKYVWLLAHLCKSFGLTPEGGIVGHFMLDPTRRTDPVTGLARGRRTYEQLLRDVRVELNVLAGTPSAGPTLVAAAGNVRTTVRLNIRSGAPTVLAPIAEVAPPGKDLAYSAFTNEGDLINGISKWYQNSRRHFFWSGGVI